MQGPVVVDCGHELLPHFAIFARVWVVDLYSNSIVYVAFQKRHIINLPRDDLGLVKRKIDDGPYWGETNVHCCSADLLKVIVSKLDDVTLYDKFEGVAEVFDHLQSETKLVSV